MVNFKLEAANFFICDEVEKGLKILEDTENKTQTGIDVDVLIWEPFEYWEIKQVLNSIEELAYNYEQIYKKGYQNGRN